MPVILLFICIPVSAMLTYVTGDAEWFGLPTVLFLGMMLWEAITSKPHKHQRNSGYGENQNQGDF